MTRQRVRNEESGFYSVWVMGLALILFMVGSMSLDLWHVFGQQRELRAIADAAAVAGASEVDIQYFKDTGNVRLDTNKAKTHAIGFAQDEATREGVTLTATDAVVNGNRVTVQLEIRVTFFSQEIDAPMKVTGTAEPALAP